MQLGLFRALLSRSAALRKLELIGYDLEGANGKGGKWWDRNWALAWLGMACTCSCPLP